MPSDFLKKYYREQAERKAKAQKEGPELLNALKNQGQTETVRIEFSGCGDSGGIDSIEGLGDKHPLRERVDEWAHEFASSLPCDWVNNEGGSGWIEMNPATGKITYSVSVNVTSEELVEKGEL